VQPLPPYPTLYEINTRILLNELGSGATLDDVPDGLLDRLAGLGIDLVWLMGVWQTGPAGRQVSRSRPDWRQGFVQELPDFREEDVTGSPFAVQSYTVHRDFGGNEALARLRQRLAGRGLRLMLDFMPNHTALDHPWVQSHPEFYIHGSEADLAAEPQNYCRVPTGRGPAILAHGRDPYFPGWPDTLQLNYRHLGLRVAMMEELDRLAELCDGLRCDMAMLLLGDVFRGTWGDGAAPADGSPADEGPFWPDAIKRVKASHPEFVFLAEVYWDLEWVLQEQGFNWTYDKRLYDRLRAGAGGAVRAHLSAPLAFQRRCARFLENHDEPRAAAVFPAEVYRPAALLTYLTPGLRFFHEGQLQGRHSHVSVHLGRRRAEPIDTGLAAFYAQLFACLKRPELRGGRWQLYAVWAAWEGNPTWDEFIAFGWNGGGGPRLLCAVHYGPTRGQCYVGLPPELRGRRVVLRDLLSPALYERDGQDLAERGLYLDMPAWGYHLFEVVLG
jgi:glycosidase